MADNENLISFINHPGAFLDIERNIRALGSGAIKPKGDWQQSGPWRAPQRTAALLQVSRTRCATVVLLGSLLGVGEALKREIAGLVLVDRL